MRKNYHSDGIKIDIDTGHNSAGNGGDGYNFGNVTTNQSVTASPQNTADTDIGAGQDHQKVSWHAPSVPHGDVTATTTATQTNVVYADQYQMVLAGVGGNGGNGNHAVGGIEVDLPHSPHSDMA